VIYLYMERIRARVSRWRRRSSPEEAPEMAPVLASGPEEGG